MKAVLSLVIAVLVITAVGITATIAKSPADPHGPIEPLKVAPETRTYMKQMESEYLKAQMLSNMDDVDFKAIRASLKQMESSAKKIRKINNNVKLNESLKGLKGQIEDVKVACRKHNLEQVKMGLGVLQTTCFGCHTAHAPRL